MRSNVTHFSRRDKILQKNKSNEIQLGNNYQCMYDLP